MAQNHSRPLGCLSVRAAQWDLGLLDIPVAEFVPGKVIERLGRIVEAVSLYGLAHFLYGPVQAGEYPSFGKGERLPGRGGEILAEAGQIRQ